MKKILLGFMVLGLFACSSEQSPSAVVSDDSAGSRLEASQPSFWNDGQLFVLKPNADLSAVSDGERVVLDSLVKAFPQRTAIDEIDGMTIFLNYDAEYRFKGSPKALRYSMGEDPVVTCKVSLYESENGLTSDLLPLGLGALSGTILLENTPSLEAIVYLLRGSTGDYLDLVKTTFKTECEAVDGSFYDYDETGAKNEGSVDKEVSVACAVKNYNGADFGAVRKTQETQCENRYQKFFEEQ